MPGDDGFYIQSVQVLVRSVSIDGQYQGLQLQENQNNTETADQPQECMYQGVQQVQEERGSFSGGCLQLYGRSQHGFYQSIS